MSKNRKLYKITGLPGAVSLDTLREIYYDEIQLELDEEAVRAIERSRKTVTTKIANNEVIYAVNTGCGKLSKFIISPEDLIKHQRNLVISHCAGVGDPLPDDVVRLVLASKIISLSRGYSGVRLQLVENLLALFNARVMPVIPEKGSVGASGDLAPLAHLALTLLGEGFVRFNGEQIAATDGLKIAGLEPLVLSLKEGVALLNGTQVSNALALRGLFESEKVFAAGLVAGALSLEAIKGSVKALDARIHQARGQLGQIEVAAAVSTLLKDSKIVESHQNCTRVQDLYSIRCVPQVMGACLDNLRYAARILQIEANSASDNPLVFSDSSEIISGGNFHGEPVAFAADIIALAVAEIGAISERRMAMLMDTNLSGLPMFLVKEGGLDSGFMTTQVTAAALVSENKCLAHPSSVDSLPTSANQEDHVSMATYAARRLNSMCLNTAIIVGIEAMAAAQGVEFHRPLRSSPILEEIISKIRENVSFLEEDRVMAEDIEQMRLWVCRNAWPRAIVDLLPSSSL